MKMYKLLFLTICLASFSLWASEPKDLTQLLQLFEEENTAFQQWEKNQKDDTQLDMNFIAATAEKLRKKHFYMLFEFKLKNAKTWDEKMAIIEDFKKLTEELYAIDKRSWEDTGSIEGMLRSYEKQSLVYYQQSLWLMPPNEAAIWEKIKDATIIIGKNDEIRSFNIGRVKYIDNPYGSDVNLEGNILLHSICQCENRVFFVLSVDLLGGGVNYDFTKFYFCEVKDDRVIKKVDLGDFYFDKLEYVNNVIYLFGHGITRENREKSAKIKVDLSKF